MLLFFKIWHAIFGSVHKISTKITCNRFLSAKKKKRDVIYTHMIGNQP